MKKIIFTSQFKKDFKIVKKSGKDMNALRMVANKLVNNEKLGAKYCDHALGGKLKGHRDCHIQGDWILIYKLSEKEVYFYRTGSHSRLFG